MLQLLIAYYHAHPIIISLAIGWFSSAVLGKMPPPDEKSGKGYIWLYGIAQYTAANLDKARDGRALAAPFTTGPLPPGTAAAPPAQIAYLATKDAMSVIEDYQRNPDKPFDVAEKAREIQARHQQPAEPGWKDLQR